MKDDANTLDKSLTDNGNDENKLPTPAKPSLKMRLFQDATKRSLLCSVFDSNTNVANETSETGESTNNTWIDRRQPRVKKRKAVFPIDDSF